MDSNYSTVIIDYKRYTKILIYDVAAWASLSELNDSSLVSRFFIYQEKKVCIVIRICKARVGGGGGT